MTNEFGIYFLGCLILGFLIGVTIFVYIKKKSPIVVDADEQIVVDSNVLYTRCSLHKIRNDSREVGKCNRSVLETSVYEVISEDVSEEKNKNLSFRGICFDFDKR